MRRMLYLTIKSIISLFFLANITLFAQAEEINPQIDVYSKDSALQAQSITLEMADQIRLQLASTQENASTTQSEEASEAYLAIIDILENVLNNYEEIAKLYGEAAQLYDTGDLEGVALKISQATSTMRINSSVLIILTTAINHCESGKFADALSVAQQVKQMAGSIFTAETQPNDNEEAQEVEQTELQTDITWTPNVSTPLTNTSGSAFSASGDRPTDSGF